MTREQFILKVEATQKAFRRFLVALCCGDSDLADDVAQESYIKAYIACDSVNNVGSFNAWIYRIGYNTFLNMQRGARLTTGYDYAATVMAPEGADAGFAYQELYDALSRLPSKERTAVLLFYMEGYSVKEIADIQEASQDAVRQYLSRGRNHLRGLLSNI